MKSLVRLYCILLALQFALNPFVPPGKVAPANRRGPAGIGSFTREQALVRTDEHGLIVQADGDGGDTAQRTGMYFFLYHDREAFIQALDQLEVYPGIYVRHPAQAGANSDPRDFSRDQQRPLIIALGKYGMTDRLSRMAYEHVLRVGKYQNLDMIGPVGVGEYLRAFDARICYPLLFVTDSFLLLSSIYLVLVASFDPDEVDDNNHAMTLLQAQSVMPTLFGRLALKAYMSFRPKNYGNSVLGKQNSVQGAFAWYHREENGGNPFIGSAMFEELKSAEGTN